MIALRPFKVVPKCARPGTGPAAGSRVILSNVLMVTQQKALASTAPRWPEDSESVKDILPRLQESGKKMGVRIDALKVQVSRLNKENKELRSQSLAWKGKQKYEIRDLELRPSPPQANRHESFSQRAQQ